MSDVIDTTAEEVVETEQPAEISYTITGQFVHRNGQVAGMFTSVEYAAEFANLVEGVQRTSQSALTLGTALAEAVNAWFTDQSDPKAIGAMHTAVENWKELFPSA